MKKNKRAAIIEQIESELSGAKEKYPSLNSTHEGYAVIKEEVDELWDMIKSSKVGISDDLMEKECVQIAAMAIRFIEDLSG